MERLAYTRREASQALGVQPCTISRLERTGKLQAIPGFQKKKLYRATDVRRLVEWGDQPATAPAGSSAA